MIEYKSDSIERSKLVLYRRNKVKKILFGLIVSLTIIFETLSVGAYGQYLSEYEVLEGGSIEPKIIQMTEYQDSVDYCSGSDTVNLSESETAYGFYRYGSDYAYIDAEKRSYTEIRKGIYNDLLEVCADFAVGNRINRPVIIKMSAGESITIQQINQGDECAVPVNIQVTDPEIADILSAISETYFMFRCDHPEYYWLSNTVYPSVVVNSYNGTIREVRLNVSIYDEYADEKYRKSLDEAIDNRTDEYIRMIKEVGDQSKYDIVKLVHDKILDDVEYGYDENGDPLDTPQAHSIVGVLDGDPDTDVVCEGYAKTFQLILNALNIDNVYVTGYAFSGSYYEAHAWNMVMMDDGEYYNFDVTWDDQENELLRYMYFAKGLGFNDDHFADSSEGKGTLFLYDLPDVPETDFIADDTDEIKMITEPIISETGDRYVKIMVDKIIDESSIILVLKNQNGTIAGIAAMPMEEYIYNVNIGNAKDAQVYAWKNNSLKPLTEMQRIEFE